MAAGRDSIDDCRELFEQQLPTNISSTKSLADLPVLFDPFETHLLLWHVQKPLRTLVCKDAKLFKEYQIMLGHAQIIAILTS